MRSADRTGRPQPTRAAAITGSVLITALCAVLAALRLEVRTTRGVGACTISITDATQTALIDWVSVGSEEGTCTDVAGDVTGFTGTATCRITADTVNTGVTRALVVRATGLAVALLWRTGVSSTIMRADTVCIGSTRGEAAVSATDVWIARLGTAVRACTGAITVIGLILCRATTRLDRTDGRRRPQSA